MLHYKIYVNNTITPKIYINIFMKHFIVPPKARCVDQRLNDEVSEMTIFKFLNGSFTFIGRSLLV